MSSCLVANSTLPDRFFNLFTPYNLYLILTHFQNSQTSSANDSRRQRRCQPRQRRKSVHLRIQWKFTTLDEARNHRFCPRTSSRYRFLSEFGPELSYSRHSHQGRQNRQSNPSRVSSVTYRWKKHGDYPVNLIVSETNRAFRAVLQS